MLVQDSSEWTAPARGGSPRARAPGGARPRRVARSPATDVRHLEAPRARPTPGSAVAGIADRLVAGTCCVRVPADRVEAKAKLGQGEADEVRETLIAGLRRPGPYRRPGLAEAMRAALEGG